MHHAGGINGFSTFYGVLPEDDLAVVVLSNLGTFRCTALARRLIDAIADLPAPAPAPLHPALPAPVTWAGAYADTLGRAQLTVEDGRLVLRREGVTHQLLPLDETTYVDESDHDVVLRLHHPDPGPAALTLSYPFSWFTGYKCDEEDRPPA